MARWNRRPSPPDPRPRPRRHQRRRPRKCGPTSTSRRSTAAAARNAFFGDLVRSQVGRPRRRRGSRRAASVLHGHHAAVHLIGSTIWPSKKWSQCKKQRSRTVRTLAALRTARQWGPARMRARASPPGFFASPCLSPHLPNLAQRRSLRSTRLAAQRARAHAHDLAAMATVDTTFRELDTARHSQHPAASHARRAAREIATWLNNALCMRVCHLHIARACVCPRAATPNSCWCACQTCFA